MFTTIKIKSNQFTDCSVINQLIKTHSYTAIIIVIGRSQVCHVVDTVSDRWQDYTAAGLRLQNILPI